MPKVKALSRVTIPEDAVRRDRKKCRKYDQCGLGEKAIFLGSHFAPRKYYVPYEAVTHVFKRVAVSAGSGKGLLAPVLYIVVQFDDGREYQNHFKYLQDADKMLDDLGRTHPEIVLMPPEGAKRAAERAENEARVARAVLSDEAEREVRKLEKAAAELEKRPSLYQNLAAAAREKRRQDLVRPGYRALALILFLAGAAALVAGILRIAGGRAGSIAFLILLAGAALMFMMVNSRVLEFPGRGRKAAARAYETAVRDMTRALKGENFPVPAALAHPAVLSRMIRIIREGRAEDCRSALAVLHDDLMAIDAHVALSGQDYEEVVAIKPLFMIYDPG